MSTSLSLVVAIQTGVVNLFGSSLNVTPTMPRGKGKAGKAAATPAMPAKNRKQGKSNLSSPPSSPAVGGSLSGSDAPPVPVNTPG